MDCSLEIDGMMVLIYLDSSYFGRAGPGLLRPNPQARFIPNEERLVAFPSLGSSSGPAAIAAILSKC
jgi:hypothetical protein